MWITFTIVAAFVVAIVAMAYFGMEGRAEAEPRPIEVSANDLDRCGLCRAPLPRAATSDEIVFELEHRIEAELREIAHALHASPESFGRLFHA